MHTAVGFACFAVAVILGLLARREWKRGSASESWPHVPCRILRSWVEADSSGEGTSYTPCVSFEYEVDGTVHRGTRLQYGVVSAGRARAERIVGPYTAGSAHICFVNPADARDAVLIRGASWGVVGLAGAAAVFAAVGCALLIKGE